MRTQLLRIFFLAMTLTAVGCSHNGYSNNFSSCQLENMYELGYEGGFFPRQCEGNNDASIAFNRGIADRNFGLFVAINN